MYTSQKTKFQTFSNGATPTINEGGYWCLNGVSTGVKAQGPGARVLLLDNDSDIIARNSLGGIIGNLPIVEARVWEGSDLVTGSEITITPPSGEWNGKYSEENVYDNDNTIIIGKKLRITDIPSDFTKGNFTFSNGVLNKIFSLSVLTSEIDYDLIVDKTLVNNTDIESKEVITVTVKKTDNTGTSILYTNSDEVGLYIGDSIQENWQIEYTKDTTTFEITLKVKVGEEWIEWDKETVEFVKNGGQGPEGAAATSYWLQSSTPIISKTASGGYGTTLVTFTPMKQTGSDAPKVCEATDNITLAVWKDEENAPATGDSSGVREVTIGGDGYIVDSALHCRMFLGDVILDEQGVEVVSDGVSISKIEYGTSTDSSRVPMSWDTNYPSDAQPSSWVWTRTTYTDGNVADSRVYYPKDAEADIEELGSDMALYAYYTTNDSAVDTPSKVDINSTSEPDKWCITLKNPNQFYKYTYRSLGTKERDSNGQYTYKWSEPELYLAYYGENVNMQTAATYFSLFGTDKTSQGMKYDSEGNLFINAEMINAGQFTVSNGSDDIIFSAGWKEFNGQKIGSVELGGWEVNHKGLFLKENENYVAGFGGINSELPAIFSGGKIAEEKQTFELEWLVDGEGQYILPEQDFFDFINSIQLSDDWDRVVKSHIPGEAKLTFPFTSITAEKNEEIELTQTIKWSLHKEQDVGFMYEHTLPTAPNHFKWTSLNIAPIQFLRNRNIYDLDFIRDKTQEMEVHFKANGSSQIKVDALNRVLVIQNEQNKQADTQITLNNIFNGEQSVWFCGLLLGVDKNYLDTTPLEGHKWPIFYFSSGDDTNSFLDNFIICGLTDINKKIWYSIIKVRDCKLRYWTGNGDEYVAQERFIETDYKLSSSPILGESQFSTYLGDYLFTPPLCFSSQTVNSEVRLTITFGEEDLFFSYDNNDSRPTSIYGKTTLSIHNFHNSVIIPYGLCDDSQFTLPTINNTSLFVLPQENSSFIVEPTFYVTKDGELYATKGNIASWGIFENYLGKGIIGTQGSLFLSALGLFRNNLFGSSGWRSWHIGAGENFGVAENGEVFAKQLFATGGQIGGWSISENYFGSDSIGIYTKGNAVDAYSQKSVLQTNSTTPVIVQMNTDNWETRYHNGELTGGKVRVFQGSFPKEKGEMTFQINFAQQWGETSADVRYYYDIDFEADGCLEIRGTQTAGTCKYIKHYIDPWQGTIDITCKYSFGSPEQQSGYIDFSWEWDGRIAVEAEDVPTFFVAEDGYVSLNKGRLGSFAFDGDKIILQEAEDRRYYLTRGGFQVFRYENGVPQGGSIIPWNTFFERLGVT